jgi:hypothetical protein
MRFRNFPHQMRFAAVAAFLATFSLCYLPLRAADNKKVESAKFLRFVEEGKTGGRLETAIAYYENDRGQKVHLVAAVHIADSGYYTSLNKIFDGYDALLYEMVKPKDLDLAARDVQQEEGLGSINFVRIIQKGLKTFLDLDYQLDGIDYTKKNFVHADLTAEEFERLQEERGESIFGMMLQQMLREMMKGDASKTAQMDPMELLAALGSPDGARQLKLLLAKQFQNMDEMVEQMEGPNGSVLLTERNKAAIKALKDQLALGKKNMGIFYGAAHMKDLESRLINDLGFKRTGVEYRIAWDLTPKGARARADDNPNTVNRSGEVGTDKDEQLKKMQEKIDRLEKKLLEMEEKEKKADK